MPFTYPCRLLEDEQNKVVYDTSTYTLASQQDWTTLTSKSLTLTKALLVYIRVKVTAGSDAYGAVRVRDDNGYNVLATGGLHNETVEREVLVPMTAGGHTLDFQAACWSNSSTSIKIEEIEIGYVNFADLTLAHYHGSVLIPSGQTDNIIYETFTTPSNNTPAGELNEVALFVLAEVQTDGYRKTMMVNKGESTPLGKYGARLKVEGVEQTWATRYNDYDDGSASNISYGEGSFGIAWLVKNAGHQFSIALVGENKSDDRTMTADLWVFACPWILPPGFIKPVSLNFPILSTLNITLEPLLSNTTGLAVYLGKTHVKSFGTDTDYYASATGTGTVLDFSYTFEKRKPSSLQLFCYSGATPLFANCVSSVMVDVR